MRPMIIRNVDEATVRRLRWRAERLGRKVNEEACRILRAAVSAEDRLMIDLEIADRSRRMATVRKRRKFERD